MKPKTSADYQREYRQRLRDQGLVKKEVWILPERAQDLFALERDLRRPSTRETLNLNGIQGEQEDMKTGQLWTTTELFEALSSTDLFTEGRAGLEMLNAAEPCLLITMGEYGDLPLFLTVSSQQILVEAILWPVASVRDPAAFNTEVLRTHKYFPLSTVGLETGADGGENYIMFGALSATSILSNVVLEIETLAENVIRATEAYEPHLNFAS